MQLDDEAHLLPLLASTTEYGLIITDTNGMTTWINTGLENLCGYTLTEMIGKKPGDLLQGPGSDAEAIARIGAAIREGRAITEELLNYRKDGTPYWVSLHITPLRNAAGTVIRHAAIAIDITARKQSEARLKLLEAALTQADEGVTITNAQLERPGPTIVFVNPAIAAITGYAPEELIGQSPRIFQGPNTERAVLDRLRESLSQGGHFHGRAVNYRKDGSAFLMEWHITPVRNAANLVTHFVAIQRDVTEQARTEAALRLSEERFRHQYKGIPIPTYTWQRDGGDYLLLDYNDAAAAITGGQVASSLGIGARQLYRDRPEILVDFEQCSESAILVKREGLYAEPLAAETRYLAITYVPIPPDILMMHTEDLTEQRQLATQLLAAQKLESVGRLAGGVAHDFNNLLTAIGGFASLAQMTLPEDAPAQTDLEEIVQVVQRAGDLTRQLLAFAGKQVLKTETIDLNARLQGLLQLLRRLLIERITLEFVPGAELWPVQVDAGQIEQVLVNLVVNARDAMPDGGTLTIATRNQHVPAYGPGAKRELVAGDYVLLAVQDTGVGMPPQVQQHMFEPFFTTKAPTKGTGLGLSTSYGIVTQHGGTILVESAVGRGTTITVYLPRALEQRQLAAGQAEELRPTGTATLLLVEDDDLVRGPTARMLRAHGHIVLEATNGDEALALALRDQPPIQLLIADIVLPDLSGPALARRLQQERPGLDVLFISGYVGQEVVEQEQLELGVNLLAKPFTTTDLLHAVQRMVG